MMMSRAFVLALSFVMAAAQWDFNYTKQGTDWEFATPPVGWIGVNRCGEEENQSPINLMEPIGSYGWAYGAALPAEWDGIIKEYQDPKEGSEIEWQMKNLRMFVDKTDPGTPESYVESKLCQLLFDCKATKFKPVQFHFHFESEHTVNGQFSTFEMHISHTFQRENGDPVASMAVAILFSVDQYDRSISEKDNSTLQNFFDQLKLNANDDDDLFFLGLEKLNFRETMNVFDFEDRYVYIGCSTLPPCTKLLYWNVLRKVYPIELRQMLLLKLKFENNDQNLGSNMNNRAIYPINGHQIYYVGGRRLALALLLAGVSTIALYL